jgi:hypothetical protein
MRRRARGVLLALLGVGALLSAVDAQGPTAIPRGARGLPVPLSEGAPPALASGDRVDVYVDDAGLARLGLAVADRSAHRRLLSGVLLVALIPPSKKTALPTALLALEPYQAQDVALSLAVGLKLSLRPAPK